MSDYTSLESFNNQKSKKKSLNSRLRKLFPEWLLVIAIYVLILPVVHSFYFKLTGRAVYTDLTITKQLLPIVVLVIILSCILHKKPLGVLTLATLIFYVSWLPPDNGYTEIVLIIFTSYAFIYTIIIGHVRSVSFIFLLIYSLIFFNWDIALIFGLFYAFCRFIFLVISQNYTVFAILGFRRSLFYLGKSFLYWSPLLLFIIPINLTKKQINKEFTREIYERTPIDTIQYHYINHWHDTLTDNFQPSKNNTTVLFIDNPSTITDRKAESTYRYALPAFNSMTKEVIAYEALDSEFRTPVMRSLIKGATIKEVKLRSRQLINKLIANGESAYQRYKNSGKSYKYSVIKRFLKEGKIQPENLMSSSFNITSEIFIDKELISKYKELLKQVDNFPMKSMTEEKFSRQKFYTQKIVTKNALFNTIDLSFVGNTNRSTYRILTSLMPKNHPLKDSSYDLAVNNISTNQLNIEAGTCFNSLNVLTSIKNSHKPDSNLALILTDISLKGPDLNSCNLQKNLEVSTVALFSRLTNKLLKELNKQTNQIDFSNVQSLSFAQVNKPEEGKNMIRNKKASLINKVDKHEDNTNRTVTKEFNALFPVPLLELENARFWEVKKLVTNAMKRNVNKRYSEQKRKMKAKIDGKIRKVYKKVRDKINYEFMQVEKQYDLIMEQTGTHYLNSSEIGATGLDKSSLDLSEMLNSAVKSTLNQTNQKFVKTYRVGFGVLFGYGLLGTISFYYLIIQTFLYVFARITISKKNKIFATLNTTTKSLPNGEIKKCGDSYTIPASDNQTYYISRIFEPSGRPPSFSIPYRSTSILPRLKSRRYTMNRVNMKGKGSSVRFRAIGSCEFVEWAIKEGEEVVFDYKNFVAISGTVKLKSVRNLRITTLILGKLFYKVAQGPGKLILMTQGRPIASGEQSSNASVPQNRILAWNVGTKFDIDTEMRLGDIYLSGFYLQKMPGDLVLIDADARGKANLGLIQYVKGLIWPF